LVGENREEVNQRLDVWRLALEGKGLMISKSKTEYVEYEFDEIDYVDETKSVMTISGDEVNEVGSYKYFGFLYKRTVVMTRM